MAVEVPAVELSKEQALLENNMEYEGSWLGTWLRWCPTSMSLLREAERRIMSCVKTPYTGYYVDVGDRVGGRNNRCWTVVFNQESQKIPLILLHGFAAAVGFWCLNFDQLAAHRPVYAFDQLGFGRSSRSRFSRDPKEVEQEFVETIEEWRKQVGLKKFILLGHSLGGYLAAAYTLRYPERVAHLILADPWGFADRLSDTRLRIQIPIWAKAIGLLMSPFNPLWGVRAAGPWGERLIETLRPDLMRKFSQTMNPEESQETKNNIIASYIYHCNAQSPSGETAFHTLSSYYGWAKNPMLHRMHLLDPSIPLTLIYGSRSWVDNESGFQIRDSRPDSYVDLQTLQGAGHHVYADSPDVFNDLVNAACEISEENIAPNEEEGVHFSIADD